MRDMATAAPALAVGIGVAFMAYGVASLLNLALTSQRQRLWVWITATCTAYLALCATLSNWMIDDAAITFAYSENLVRGFGLRLHPALAPEEGYSNTLWMLWLAALRALGVPITIGAKVSCLAIGVLTCVAVHFGATRLLQATETADTQPTASTERTTALVAAMVLCGAPYLVWSASGLEHGLQALAILVAAIAPLFWTHHLAATSIALCALVLVRPEAPLLVATCFGVHVFYALPRVGWLGAIRSNLLVALIPAVVWAGLIAFRLAYFGDPLPNPFYAKASDATFARVLNVVGGSWGYVLSWAFGSGFLIVIPPLARAIRRPVPLPIALILGLVASHLTFVLYAAGDWMGCWRFISPIIPALAVLVAWAYHAPVVRANPGGSTLAAGLTMAFLALGTTTQYLAFAAGPTTPYLVVTSVGQHFVDLAARLGVKEPKLAHHDAGGTSYLARIHLIDLGGLGNRAIAKHWDDPEFIAQYVLHEEAPDFIFGASQLFAAGRSLFWQRPEFDTLYVRLEFLNTPVMSSDLCHIKRSIVNEQALPPGISVERTNGVVSKVIVQ
jgi:hypothetical protein